MRVLSIDPGGMTGLAYFDNGVHYAWMLPHGEDQDWLAEWVKTFQLVVCESFNIGARTLKLGQAGTKQTIETIGVARFLARREGVAFKLQEPAASSLFDRDWSKLRKLGWYTPGPDHARSASRHLLLACAELGLVPLESLR